MRLYLKILKTNLYKIPSRKRGYGECMVEAYCVKCKAKKTMKDAKSVTLKNGKPATSGVCPSCGTKMFRIGAAK